MDLDAARFLQAISELEFDEFKSQLQAFLISERSPTARPPGCTTVGFRANEGSKRKPATRPAAAPAAVVPVTVVGSLSARPTSSCNPQAAEPVDAEDSRKPDDDDAEEDEEDDDDDAAAASAAAAAAAA